MRGVVDAELPGRILRDPGESARAAPGELGEVVAAVLGNANLLPALGHAFVCNYDTTGNQPGALRGPLRIQDLWELAMPDGRIAVLLGAGASVDAGLPVTNRLAENILRRVNEAHQTPAVQALNFVYGAMVGHQAEEGGDPLKAVNIETLVSALRLLKDREGHEASPFVASWKSGALGFGEREPLASEGRALLEELSRNLMQGHGDGSSIAERIAKIARKAVGAGSSHVFEGAERIVLKALKEELGNPTSTGYLRTLCDLATAQGGGLDVICLNYDLALQRAAEAGGVHIDTAMERWSPGLPIVFDQSDAVLRIIKVHGSLDWALKSKQSVNEALQAPDIAVGVAGAQDLPWIVVGDREKLATDGPTLRLFQAAFDALGRADHLVVVGYSFSDSHINAMIRDWMLVDEGHTMTVLDPIWPSADDCSDRSFKAALLREYARTRGGEDEKHPIYPRLLALEGTAGSSLAEALKQRPEPDPVPYFGTSTTARVERNRCHFALELVNQGRPLRMVSLQVTLPGWLEGQTGIFELESDRDAMSALGPAPQGLGPRARSMNAGDSWQVFGIAPEDTEAIEVWVHGSDPIIGGRSDTIRVSLRDVNREA